MTDQPEREVARLRARIGAKTDHEAAADVDVDEAIPEADRALLRTVSNRIRLMGRAQFSDHRHEFYLRRGTVIARNCGGLADAIDDRDVAERIVGWINATYDSPETNKDYRVTLRNLGKLATEGDDIPDALAWVPAGYPDNHDPAPKPEEMYRLDEHIRPMLDACNNSRDRALIALAWDVGPRAGELFNLTVDRFTDHKYGMQVTLREGKQGTRSPVLIFAEPRVRQWLEDHPEERGTDAPLWTRTTTCAGGLSNNRVRDIFKERAEAAAMTPPSKATPTRMRKSSASFLASEGVSQAHLEAHHGWKTGSDKAARYISVFGEQNDREIARAHGMDVSADESEPIAPIPCPRCGQRTPREHGVCIHCNRALDHETNQVLAAVSDTIDELLVETDDADSRSKLVEAKQTLDEKPAAVPIDELHQLLTSLDSDAD